MPGRGQLTNTIQEKALAFLGRSITLQELRLYPYLDYQMKNEQRLDLRKCNEEDRQVLSLLRKEGHIEGGATGLSMTHEFYTYINEVLWFGYVISTYATQEA